MSIGANHFGKAVSFVVRPYVTLPVVAIVVLLLITDFTVHMTTGDSITTSRVAFAGDVFADVGLIGQRFKPAFYVPVGSTDLLRFYTHFPALPYYYGWIVAEASPWPWPTLVAGYVFVAAGTMACWVYTAEKLISRTLGWLVGVIMLALAPTFALLPYNAKSWADLWLGLAVVVTVRVITRPTEKFQVSPRQWGLLGIFAFGVSLSSYEYIPAIILITIGLVASAVVIRPGLSPNERLRVAGAGVMRVGTPIAVGILVAMAFHTATNLWALGSVEALIKDMRGATASRTDGGDFLAALPTIGAFLAWLDDSIHATYWTSWIWVALIIASVVRVGQVARDRLLLALGVLLPALWAGFLAFNLVFRQWAWVHFRTIGARHFIVPAAFTFAAGIYAFVRGLRTDEIRRFRRPVASLLVVASILVVGVGLVRNVQATASFLADADQLSMAARVDDLRMVLAAAEKLGGASVLTDDNGLVLTGFLHVPRDYFDLDPLLVEGFALDEWEHIATTARRDAGCGDAEPCVLVLTERIADLSFRERVCERSECWFHGRWTLVRLEAVT